MSALQAFRARLTLRDLLKPATLAQAVRSSLLLMLVGASIALFFQELLGRRQWLSGFLTGNQLPLPDRHKILLSMGITGGALVLIAWCFLLWFRSERAVDIFRRVTLVLSPLALIGLWLPLGQLKLWQDDSMLWGSTLALVIVGVELSTYRCFASLPERLGSWIRGWSTRFAQRFPRALPILALLVVILGAIGYGIFVSFLTIRLHHRLGTAAYDLGGYDNIFFNALRNHPLRGTVAVPSGEDWSSIRTHAEFSVYVFLPFYALRPSSEALLCIQAFTVGLGAVPTYLLAARHLPRSGALLLAAAYLLFAPLHSGNFYDFHFQPLASTLILWCFYFLDSRRNLAFAVMFCIALGCREDVSMSFAVAGALMVGAGFRPTMGFVVALTSTIYFVLIRFVIMPRFGGWWFHDMYKDLLPPGDASLFGVIKTVVSNPVYAAGTLLTKEKALHILKIMLPLAFLPLRKPGLLLGYVPAVLGTILTTGYHPTTDTTFQYVFYWVPFIFVNSTIVLEDLRKRFGAVRQASALVAMAVATLFTSYHWGVVFQHEVFSSAWGRINLAPLTPQEWQTLQDLKELGAGIPQSASMALSESETPHYSTRLTVYALRAGGHHDADYVLYRVDTGGHGADQANEALKSGKYERKAQKGRFVLLQRKGM